MKKVWNYLEENLEEILLVILLAAMSIIMMIQVILRLMSAGLTWAEEFCRYCFVYSGLLSAGYCIRKGVGIRVDVIFNFFPKPVQIIIDYLGKLLTTVLYGYLAYSSISLIQSTTSISTAMQLPMQVVYAALPIGFGLGCIRGVQDLVKFTIKTFGKKQPEEAAVTGEEAEA